MKYLFFNHRIRKLNLPSSFNLKDVIVGTPFSSENCEKLGLKNIGEAVVPSPTFGKTCEINANGYSYKDTSKPKENRYITTIRIEHPHGNLKADPVYVDIHRDCYQTVHVKPDEIEVLLSTNKTNEKFLLAHTDKERDIKQVINAINIFIETFGECYLYRNFDFIENKVNIVRCNWSFLPTGERISDYIKRNGLFNNKTGKKDKFFVKRIELLEKYKIETLGIGKNGFYGYYAFVFKKCCVFESAIYGNATYIVPSGNWKELSQKTKKELLESEDNIKIVHNTQWLSSVQETIKINENQYVKFSMI